MKLYLEIPRNFHFNRTVNSHGWRSLAPFKYDETSGNLSYVFGGEDLKNPVAAVIGEEDEKLKIEISGDKISSKAQAKILHSVRHILRFDDDLNGFYRLVKKEKEFVWIAKQNAGRLLRSPTVFEDLVKTIATTNCSWALTKNMVNNLAAKLGEASKDGRHAFPTAEKMAEMPPAFYRDEIRAGYRSAYFAELAEKVASGKLNPEQWLDTDLPTRELKKQMKQAKGVGDYAAENLLKLVGRYDGLALDSMLRGRFYKQRNAKTVCADKEIENFYARFNEWKGLAIWCDMSK
ncbi:MAG: DNA-3-methyladenine glycosylase family protein [Pyrinomonadaceae bacterium]